MHLGRFHHVVDHLERHFSAAKLAEILDAAVSVLEQYSQSRTESLMAEFRNKLAQALDSSDDVADELLQPYAQQVIGELGLKMLFPPEVRSKTDEIVAEHGFDSVSLATALKKQAKLIGVKVSYLKQLDGALRSLSVEYTEVAEHCAEFGLLLPRNIVGEKLPDLSKEFDSLSKLARAVNELSGQPDYDPQVVTISSSWWQIFLDIPIDQVAIWTLAIERIVTLFKSNLEIKQLQKQLSEKAMPDAILKAISDEVDKKVSGGLKSIATDLMAKFATIEDRGRRNEIETQLRQGLHYLAKRMNEGAQVELNVGLPDEPEDPVTKEGEEPNQQLLEANSKIRERLAQLRQIRGAAMKASEASLQLDTAAPLLLSDLKSHDDLE
jgi:transcriptional regulator with XRE-family HTH domain